MLDHFLTAHRAKEEKVEAPATKPRTGRPKISTKEATEEQDHTWHARSGYSTQYLQKRNLTTPRNIVVLLV